MSSGLIEPLHDSITAKLSEKLPGRLAVEVAREVQIYVAIKATDNEPKPSVTEKYLDGLLLRIANLAREIRDLPDPARRHVAEAETITGGKDRHETAEALERFCDILGIAGQRLVEGVPGRQIAQRTNLIIRLAEILGASGIEPDTRPTGPLCQATKIILDGLGEGVTNIRSVVVTALEHRKSRQRE